MPEAAPLAHVAGGGGGERETAPGILCKEITRGWTTSGGGQVENRVTRLKVFPNHASADATGLADSFFLAKGMPPRHFHRFYRATIKHHRRART